jgi:hypothetical protein
MMFLIHLSDQAQGAIASGMFTLFVFSVQTALLYSRFETRRKEELQHKEMEGDIREGSGEVQPARQGCRARARYWDRGQQ